MKFTELNLDSRLLRSIAERGYTEMTEVQKKALPITIQGQDVAVQSQTGTGKTAAFLITLYERLLKKERSGNRALIIVPTRELAVQIEKEAQLLNRDLGFSIGTFFGGVGYKAQLSSLKKRPEIIIGTPGRLLDLSQKNLLKLKETAVLIIDEADRLFDMGFLPDIKKIMLRLPPNRARQNMLFSATLNRMSRQLAAEHMNHPVSIAVDPEKLTVETIFQELYYVKSHIKLNLMLGILKKENPKNVLVFTNMRHTAFRLAKKLQINGLNSQYLTGDLPQKQRLRIIDEFKSGEISYLVATDVAARGLHIDDLDMVINYDIPQDCENYVHRIGRTARAGNSGKAISFASERMSDHLEAIESYIGMQIPEKEADFELFVRDKSEGVHHKENPHSSRFKRSRRDSQSRNKKSTKSRFRSSHKSSHSAAAE